MVLISMILSSMALAMPSHNQGDQFAQIFGDFEKLAVAQSSHSGRKIYEWQWPREFVDHPELGFHHRPNSKIRAIRRLHNEIVFDSTYNFDEYGRRQAAHEPSGRQDFFALFGCSFTYGNGLNDNETLNHFINKKSRRYRAYNYAIGASAPNMLLRLLETNDLTKQISQPQGLMAYIYIGDHVERSNGYLQHSSWMGPTPYYESTSAGMKYKGSLSEHRPWRTKFLDLLFNTVGFVKQGYTFTRISQENYEYTCNIIAAAEEEFLKQYPQSKFAVVVHPLSGIQPPLKRCLENKGMALYEPKVPQPRHRLVIPFDGHPNAELNARLSEELLKVARASITEEVH